MELRAENVEKLNVGDYPGARLCKGLLLDAIEAGDKLETRVKDLETENERLKDRCEKFNEWRDSWHNMMKEAVHEIRTLRKENSKLKCLALHLFSNYFFDCYWNSKGLDPNRYLHLHEKYEEAIMSNLVRTETIYAIKRVVMEKHPLTEKKQ